MVQSNTMVGPGSDAAVIRIKGTKKALAMTLDGPAYRVARNPREGAKLMVAEACRNIVCSGAQPVAATNCLNFGNPEHPEVMWQFSEVVDGMSEACAAFGTPITGGNVSFYNETHGEDIYPTPVLGVIGVADDTAHVTASWFQEAGDVVVLVETAVREAGRVVLEDEIALQRLVLEAIRAGLVRSAHDTAEGGLAIAIAECCYRNIHRPAIGAAVKIPSHLEATKDLFGEYTSRILLTTRNAAEILRRAKDSGLQAVELGTVGGERLVLEYEGQKAVDIAIGELETAWEAGLAGLLS
jgi:phosphoribosylformylglycinamidine synthase